MNLKINDKYEVVSDSYCYILREHFTYKKGKHKGEKGYSNIGYYPTIELLLKKLVKLQVKETELKELEDIIELLVEIDNDIVNALREHTESLERT